MVCVVPMARATFDRCWVVLDVGATLPEALGRVRTGTLGLRGVMVVKQQGRRFPSLGGFGGSVPYW